MNAFNDILTEEMFFEANDIYLSTCKRLAFRVYKREFWLDDMSDMLSTAFGKINGIYFLWGTYENVKTILYIGVSNNIVTRLKQHHKGGIPFESFQVFDLGNISRNELEELEYTLINRIKPPLNIKVK
jgi:hypothetical protein